MSKSRHWCFTINNPTEETERHLSTLKNTVEYLIYGREVGEQGTPHLQGYACFPSRRSLRQVTDYFTGGHCSIARHIGKSITYCKKDGDFVEIGEPPKKAQGKRNDLESFKEDVKGGMSNVDEITEVHSNVVARYPRFVERYMRMHMERPVVETHPLREWQEKLNSDLKKTADDRTIVFLVDHDGNQGKTWFCSYYQNLHPQDTQIILPGKKQDMAYALREDIRVLFVDAPRSKQGDYLQYDFLEEVKNGRVFSTKYDSRMKTFKPPHVVVAMNEYPKMDMLSSDRYDVRELS